MNKFYYDPDEKRRKFVVGINGDKDILILERVIRDGKVYYSGDTYRPVDIKSAKQNEFYHWEDFYKFDTGEEMKRMFDNWSDVVIKYIKDGFDVYEALAKATIEIDGYFYDKDYYNDGEIFVLEGMTEYVLEYLDGGQNHRCFFDVELLNIDKEQYDKIMKDWKENHMGCESNISVDFPNDKDFSTQLVRAMQMRIKN